MELQRYFINVNIQYTYRNLRLLGLAWLLAVVIWLWPSLTQAQGPTFVEGDSLGTSFSEAVALGDLDGDGDLDAFVGNMVTGFEFTPLPAKVWLNQGGAQGGAPGVFIESSSLAASLTEAVALGDLDGDGDLDAFVANRDANKIWLNQGGAQGGTASDFIATAQNLGSSDSLAVALGDLDGDGDLDAFVGNDGANKIWLNQTAQGMAATFTEGSSLGTSDSQAVALGDLDGDGDLDAFIGNAKFGGSLNDRANKIWVNQTAQGMAATFTEGSSLGTSDSQAVALGDLDGDGDLDAFVGNTFNSTPLANKIWVNETIPGMAINFTEGSSLGNSESYAIALGDLDSDGDLDAYVANDDANKVWLNETTLGMPAMFTEGPSLGTADSQAVALGDLDGDGDLDSFVGNFGSNKIWLNQFQTFFVEPNLPSNGLLSAAVALGDLDGDDDLDAFVANLGTSDNNRANAIWLNQTAQGVPATFVTSTLGISNSSAIALGDLDGDGDLDAFIGNGAGGTGSEPNTIWLNQTAQGMPATFNLSASLGSSASADVALGDLDGDGDLDAFVANGFGTNQPNTIWLNQTAQGAPATFELSASLGNSASAAVALGDLDGDGDLDAFVGNTFALIDGEITVQPNEVWLNQTAQGMPATFELGASLGNSTSFDVALGDLDGDGDLDAFVGNVLQSNLIWVNQGGIQGGISGDFNQGPSVGSNPTGAVALGDLDGDGDLDAFVGNRNFPNEVWLNQSGAQGGIAGLFSKTKVVGGNSDRLSVALGDLDNDGDLDTFVGNLGPNKVWLNQNIGLTRFSVATARPVPTDNANFYSTPIRLDDQRIPISYTLFHPNSETLLGQLQVSFSLDGGDNWQPAMVDDGTKTTNLAASPYPTGTTHTFTWDTFASGVFGQSDNVVIRMEIYPQPIPVQATGTYTYPSQIPGPYQWPSASTATFPFRVQGTQIRVINEASAPVSNALVYRLPEGQVAGGFPIGGPTPFRTGNDGFLIGRGVVAQGDQLFALAPIAPSATYTERFSDTIHLFHTSGTPTETGIESPINGADLTITNPGIQTLTVSAERPLILFDLTVALEWDSSKDPTYLSQLEFDLKKASKHMYDFTDGQMALNDVVVFQNSDNWRYSEVVVHANNHFRPYAVIGGMVVTKTVDIVDPDVSYFPGQIHMGATWNRYGNPGQSLGEDWPLVLAHELAHFFLFLDDTYLGLDDNDQLIAVGDCLGSAMGDIYAVDNTEFIADPSVWAANCSQTLPDKTKPDPPGRTEWQIIKAWYPELTIPSATLAGPSFMPYELTTVTIQDPITQTNAILDPTFFIDYQSGASTSEAKALLLRDLNGDTKIDFVLDLGGPIGGQNRIKAFGAQPGDRLCVFDPPQLQFGCEVIEAGDERLTMRKDPTWAPVIQISPVSSTTFKIDVSGIGSGATIKARIFPEFGFGFAEETLNQVGDDYTANLKLDYPSLSGHIQIWVDEAATEQDPRREAIVAFSIGGNPGAERTGAERTGGKRGGGAERTGAERTGAERTGAERTGAKRGNAAVISPDGQMIVFNNADVTFAEGEFYTVQTMASLPELPPGKTTVGAGYNLFATNKNTISGSVSIQYQENNVLTEQVEENELTIHYWNGTIWEVVEGHRDSFFNLVSAPSQGPGIYALLAGVAPLQITNVTPPLATNDSDTIVTIDGVYFLPPNVVTLVDPTDAANVHTLTISSIFSNSIAVTVPAGLPAREYRVNVTNGDGGVANPDGEFALFAPLEACFYDFFESGTQQWTRAGDWDVVILPDGQRAMTDSPSGAYKNASDYGAGLTTFAATITSNAFAIDGDCINPSLAFRHDYAIVNLAGSEDQGLVEISKDGGATWTTLQSFTGGIAGLETSSVESTEWTTVAWEEVNIDLADYIGETVQLRFNLVVNDDSLASKGWIIDDVRIQGDGAPGPPIPTKLYLPLVFKEYTPPAIIAPDLVVQSITAIGNNVEVVIKNRGTGPATDAFWVDVYLDPSRPPVAVNELWNDLSSEGLVWGVTEDIAIGGELTLMLGDAYYVAAESNFSGSIAEGTAVYAQVDSAHGGTTYGAVLELHEITGGVYNNILGAVVSAISDAPDSFAPEDGVTDNAGLLPPRR